MFRIAVFLGACLLPLAGLFAQRTAHTLVWENTFGGDVLDIATALAPTPSSGGYIFTGYTKSVGAGGEDVWLVKTDKNGNVVWQKTIGGTKNDAANSIALTHDGGYVVAGYTYSKGSGESDVWVIKTDAQGNPQWEHTYGGLEADQAVAVLPTADGGYWIAAYHSKAPTKSSDMYSSIEGSTAASAEATQSQPRQQVIWLLKLNAAGLLQWNETYESADQNTPTAMLPMPDGGVLLVGNTLTKDRSSEGLLIRVKSDGSKIWQKNIGTNAWDALQAALLNADNQILVGGTQFVSRNNADAWLLKITLDGEIVWQHTYGSSENETIQQLALADEQHIAAAINITSPYAQPDLWMFAAFNAQGIMRESQIVGSTTVQQIRALQPAPDKGFMLLGVPTLLRKCLQRGDRSTWLFRWGQPTEIDE